MAWFSRSGQMRRAAAMLCAAAVTLVGCGDGSKLVLNRQAEAHRLASHLHVQFSRAADASNRAVMAETDEASGAAAKEAGQATRAVQQDAEELRRILEALGDRDEAQELARFNERFTQYRALDADILPLAVENTNIKAQRLSFGPAQEAVGTYRRSVDAAARMAPPRNASAADAAAARGAAAVLEIQVIQARHIAESDEAAMANMESAMKASLDAARRAIESMRGVVPAGAAPSLAAASAALDQLVTLNAEIVALSRRNSNVRSLALSLGKKRTVTAECDDILQALEDKLAAHHFSATR